VLEQAAGQRAQAVVVLDEENGGARGGSHGRTGIPLGLRAGRGGQADGERGPATRLAVDLDLAARAGDDPVRRRYVHVPRLAVQQRDELARVHDSQSLPVHVGPRTAVMFVVHRSVLAATLRPHRRAAADVG
jgi:hypothetical protein